ncbi:hypothetical protein [Rhodanobacter lindaniclasticus]
MQNSYWRELHVTRRDWAYAAHEVFLAGAGADMKEQGRQGKHVTAVLYGSTQVGKTTLILHMLGVAPGQVEPIAELLRGGQGSGKSATAAALRYRRSADELWHLGSADAPGLSDEAVREHFSALREQVEAGTGARSVGARDLIDVYLPSNCFGQNGIGDVDIRLVDLPGLNAANDNERAHVQALARRHVPNADLVILVGKVNSLGFLAPDQDASELPELSWWAAPHRFRIVCTSISSDDNTAEWLRRQEQPVSMEEVRARLVDQFNTHDFQFPSDMKKSLYAVEMGQSLRGLKEHDPAGFERTVPLVDAFMSELIAGIRQAANPWFRLKSAWELPRTVRRECQAGTLKRMEHLRHMGVMRADLLKRARNVRKAVVTLEKKIDARRDDLAWVNDFKEAQVLAILNKEFSQASPPSPPSEKTVSAMHDCVEASLGKLVTQWESFAEHRERCFEGWPKAIDSPGLGSPPESSALKDLCSKLEEYRTDSYWLPRLIGGSWDRDVGLLHDAYMSTREQYMQCAAVRIRNSLEAARKDLSGRIRRDERKLQGWRRVEGRREHALRVEVDRWAEVKNELRMFWKGKQESIEYGGNFMSHMQSAFLSECRRRREEIICERNPAKRFQQWLLLPVIEREYVGMKRGVAS